MSSTVSSPQTLAETAAVAALTRAFVQACRQLGKAGRPSDAMRIAAQGWSALWTSHPDDAERINGVMHYLARLEQQLAAQVDAHHSGASMPTRDRVIDIRPETPKRRHEIIFDTFDALPPGSAYVIVNDHVRQAALVSVRGRAPGRVHVGCAGGRSRGVARADRAHREQLIA